MDGWISIHRKIIESEIWEKPPLYIKVWVYLLVSAQHSTYKGLKRGQVRTSIPEIINACKWRVGARIERPTKDQVYQILEWLRKPNEGVYESNAKATMITTTKATQGMLININNYAVYQDTDRDESNDEGNDENLTNPRRKQRRPDNINNNDNNVNNNNKKDYTSDFELFWNSYPRKVAKKEAAKTFEKVIKAGEDPNVIIQCATNYQTQCNLLKTESQFIKHPKTFLNEERYKDYLENSEFGSSGSTEAQGRLDFMNDI
ncbi:hypothetical protein ACP8HI_13575 [Paenibacillus sp. FA6]|uniref:hypothetical protein n=1 Tax=Paenibacillus sp. FA6 TaxID=3413029 RepID=UPI003F6596A0